MKKILALIVGVALFPSAVWAQGWSVDIFGGGSSGGNLVWDGTDYLTNPGQTYGIGISHAGLLPSGVELGFELSHNKQEYTGYEPNYISGTAALGTARYTFVNTGGFEMYGGAGLGAVHVTYDAGSYANSATVAGGQIMLGGRYAISDSMKIFAEARYLDTFQDAMVALSGATATAAFNATSIVAGLRVSF